MEPFVGLQMMCLPDDDVTMCPTIISLIQHHLHNQHYLFRNNPLGRLWWNQRWRQWHQLLISQWQQLLGNQPTVDQSTQSKTEMSRKLIFTLLISFPNFIFNFSFSTTGLTMILNFWCNFVLDLWYSMFVFLKHLCCNYYWRYWIRFILCFAPFT